MVAPLWGFVGTYRSLSQAFSLGCRILPRWGKDLHFLEEKSFTALPGGVAVDSHLRAGVCRLSEARSICVCPFPGVYTTRLDGTMLSLVSVDQDKPIGRVSGFLTPDP